MRRAILASTILASLALSLLPPIAKAQIGTSVPIDLAPPDLPVYEQPAIPAPGYIWTPGYWAYAPESFYWVPATWVLPPSQDMLWTPGYWRFGPRGYVWNPGYWGMEVGYYGGIDYGYGYNGSGYAGGYWENHTFYYNRAVNNFGGVHVAHEYNRAVGRDERAGHRASFNGGLGDVTVKPTPREAAYTHLSHTPPVALQMQHQQAASRDRALFQSSNHGEPPVAATSRAIQFSRADVMEVLPASNAAPARPETEWRGTSPGRPANERIPAPQPDALSLLEGPATNQVVPELIAGQPTPRQTGPEGRK